MYELAEELLGAWNSQDVDQVLARYTKDVVYVAPNTRGEVNGAEALRKYLSKLSPLFQSLVTQPGID